MSNKKVKVGGRWVSQEEAEELLRTKYFDDTKKTFAILKKKGSPHFIAYQVDSIDDGDEWFLECMTVKNTTKEIISSSTITINDLETSISYYSNVLKFIQISKTY
jgi:hypothetical protein